MPAPTGKRAVFSSRLRGGLLSVGVGLAATIGTSDAVAEKWTSLSGERTIEAKMVGMWEQEVILILPDGRRVNVPLNSLNAVSRIQAGDLAEKMKQDRAALAQELKQAAAIAAAPAPDPLPMPPAAPAYAPPSPSMTPAEAIDTVSQQIRAGHLVAIYDALPPTYRTQIDDLTRLATTKLSPAAWNEAFGQLHRIADLIVTRQNWVLSHPNLHAGQDQAEELTAQGIAVQDFVLPLAGLIREGIPTDAIALEKIREAGLGPWLHERDAAIAPYLADIMQRYSAPGATWTVTSSEDETAILEQSTAASPTPPDPQGRPTSPVNEISIEVKKVDGFWIPAAVADGFEDWIKQQTVALEAYEDGQMSLSDWLGGTTHTATPSAPVAAQRDQFGMGPGAGPMENDPAGPMFEEPEIIEEEMFAGPADGPAGGPAGGYAPRGAPPKLLEPSAITPELIGTILQSSSTYGSLIQPLESATTADSFHQAADQLLAPIQAVLSLLAPEQSNQRFPRR